MEIFNYKKIKMMAETYSNLDGECMYVSRVCTHTHIYK